MKTILDDSMLCERRYQCRLMHLQPKSSFSFANHTIPSIIKGAAIKQKKRKHLFNKQRLPPPPLQQ